MVTIEAEFGKDDTCYILTGGIRHARVTLIEIKITDTSSITYGVRPVDPKEGSSLTKHTSGNVFRTKEEAAVAWMVRQSDLNYNEVSKLIIQEMTRDKKDQT